MYFNPLTVVALLAGLTFASPIVQPAADNTTTTLFRRANSCTASLSVNKQWDITLDNDVSYNDACGSGCLDNIRGRCGVVSDWGCRRNAAGQGIYHFSTSSFCTEYDMTQALKACTRKEQTINCNRITGA